MLTQIRPGFFAFQHEIGFYKTIFPDLTSVFIAGFDLDHTLIRPNAGRKFPKNVNDWQIRYENIVDYFEKWVDSGINKLVIFTNQKNTSPIIIATKVQNILNYLKIKTATVLIATDSEYHRKPCVGMWEYVNILYPNLDKSRSFYVGDALGRANDFSDSDLKFAVNIGLPVYSPEAFFLGEENPKMSLSTKTINLPLFEPANFKLEQGKIYVMVGLQGSGKSTFIQAHAASVNFKIISFDQGHTLKSLERAYFELRSFESLIIDNMSTTKMARKKLMEVFDKHQKREIICLLMNLTEPEREHNLKVRKILRNYQGLPDPITSLVLKLWKNRYEAPELSEGFSSIIKINQSPVFLSDLHRKIYSLHL